MNLTIEITLLEVIIVLSLILDRLLSRACPSFSSNTGGITVLLDKEYTFHIGSVTQICDLLKNLDKDRMIKLAIMNFNKTKEYGRKLLDEKRYEFYRMFANNITLQ